MGCGKTHEAIALDELWYSRTLRAIKDGKAFAVKGKVPPTLVIAPLNTFDSWQDKYAVQSPDTTVYTIDRKKRGDFIKAISTRRADVYLMHWDALRLLPELRKFQFNVIIADEVHRAANRKAQATQSLKKLRTNFKLGLSGTASGDRPENLWSVLNWLYPTYYSSYWNFVKYYCIYEVDERGYRKMVGVKNTDLLKKEISPFFTRHLKKEECCPHHPRGVMEWLPDKTYDRIWVDLSPSQRKVYEQMKKHMVAWVGEHEDSPLVASVVVAQLTRLSQMALATPRLETRVVRERHKGRDGVEMVDVHRTFVELELPSSKLDAVLGIFEDHPEKSFVVMSSSKKACYLLQGVLQKKGISSGVLSGDTTMDAREKLKSGFRKGEIRVFIGVIAAASEGIDGLQDATDTIIFLDRDWSSFRNKQAEDRLHREGQKDTVQVIDIMARDTVDMGRHQKLEAKWQWIRAMLGDGKNG
jgi:SWI/SNF-related matrix-associated actin-dependent regulator of chromatin subfamily A member 5